MQINGDVVFGSIALVCYLIRSPAQTVAKASFAYRDTIRIKAKRKTTTVLTIVELFEMGVK